MNIGVRQFAKSNASAEYCSRYILDTTQERIAKQGSEVCVKYLFIRPKEQAAEAINKNPK
jgi:hypothetical protein